MNKLVRHVQLHAVPFVEGCGQLKSTFSSQNYVGMKMVWTPDGVLVDYKNISFVIPLANIIAATFVAPEVAAAAISKPLTSNSAA